MQLAKSAISQTTKLGKELLSQGMLKALDAPSLDTLMKKLASRDTYHSHGSVIDASEAKALGLNVNVLDPASPLWKKLWLLRTMYAFDCRTRGYSKLFEGKRISSPVMSAPKAP